MPSDLNVSEEGTEGTEAAVMRILRESVGVDAALITAEARLVEDLKIDSLDRIELVFELESAFGIDIPDEAIVQVQTVGDVVRRIDDALAAPRSRPAGQR